MQVSEVMTREVVTVGPDTSARYPAEIVAERGVAAVPVVDDDDQLEAIAAEADVLAERLPPDPAVHLWRERCDADVPPPLLVRGVMTAGVRAVDATAVVSDAARLFAVVSDAARLFAVVSDAARLFVEVADGALRAVAHTVAGGVGVRVLHGVDATGAP